MVELCEAFETVNMVSHENLDVRTITMGISLLDCTDGSLDAVCGKIRDKILKSAGNNFRSTCGTLVDKHNNRHILLYSCLRLRDNKTFSNR